MPNRTCSFDGCDRPYKSNNLCDTHSAQLRRTGSTWPIPVRSWPERFWAKVDKTDTCWLWTGATQSDGYGGAFHDGAIHLAHRKSYELMVGPIPEGLTLDHLCRVRNCVNPTHLEPVTNEENVRRGMAASARNRRKTHCIRGHEFTPENTKMRDGKWRQCRTCVTEVLNPRRNEQNAARRALEVGNGRPD